VASGGGKQVQVMVAQDAVGGVAQGMHAAQDRQRLATTIDQIAAEPEAIRSWVEVDRIEETAQRIVATLDVTDRPVGHGEALM